MAPKTIEQLRQDLLSLYSKLRKGEVGSTEVKDAANLAGKIISTAKTQIEYNKLVQSKERIPFLEC